jgi:DNA-binding NarL/FixJ family response regulator
LPPADAAAALRDEVRAGRLDGTAVDAVLRAVGHRPPRARSAWPAGLTDREVEVLVMIARVSTNREFAEALGITEKTVGNHIEHIHQKSGVSTRAAATLFALQAVSSNEEGFPSGRFAAPGASSS